MAPINVLDNKKKHLKCLFATILHECPTFLHKTLINNDACYGKIFVKSMEFILDGKS